MGLLQPHGRHGCGDGQASIDTAVVFTGYADAVFFLEAARRVGRSVALTTEPGASRYLGAAWFAALQDLLLPLGAAKIIYDCGDRTGDALAALRHHVRTIRIDPAVLTPALTNLATKHGATVLSLPVERLVFGTDRHGENQLLEWLSASAS